MKKIILPVLGLLVLVGMYTYVTQPQGTLAPSADYVVDTSDMLSPKTFVSDGVPVVGSLSSEEVTDLVYMREEEKLARDVYTVLGETWGLRIFSNIAASEQTHMDTLGILLQRYGIEDPVRNDTTGVFTSEPLQQLYTTLVEKGKVSSVEALLVGATIEDLDIQDLIDTTSRTDKADITAAYANLQKGSRNHLRAFTKNIQASGATYVPQYISVAQYEAIISSATERGRI